MQSPRPFKVRPAAWGKFSYSSGLQELKGDAEVFTATAVKDPRTTARYPKSKLVHQRQTRVRDQPDDAFGNFVMTRGEHKFVYEIECDLHKDTKGNDRLPGSGFRPKSALPSRAAVGSGSGIRVGVASKDGSKRWGIRPSDGRAVSQGDDIDHRDYGPTSNLLADAVMPCQQARAVGTRVEVTVNMARRIVKDSVDGATAVDSGVLPDDYPDELIPWCQLFYQNDAVTLSDHRFRPVNHPPSPRSPSDAARKDTRKRVESIRATPYFEAGPWTDQHGNAVDNLRNGTGIGTPVRSERPESARSLSSSRSKWS